MATLHLKSGRDRSLQRRHPWIFSGAVRAVEGEPAPGGTVTVAAAGGQVLGKAAWSPQSQIQARMWSFDPHEEIDADFFRRRLADAVAARRLLGLDADPDGACRLVHGESDGLPGLVVDRYGPVLVAQLLAAGTEHWREVIADALVEVTGLPTVFERSDADVRRLEGLAERAGPLRGPSPGELTIAEHGLRFLLDPAGGHKTGFYLDQRDNRLRVRGLCAGREVLDCFSFSGGFALNALQGGATAVVALDSSAPALALARRIADNLVTRQFHKGFFLPSADHLFAKVDEVTPLALLYLEAALRNPPVVLPPYCGGRSFFHCDHEGHGRAYDGFIYNLTRGE